MVTRNGQPLNTRNTVTGRSSFLEVFWTFCSGLFFGAGIQVASESVRAILAAEEETPQLLQSADGRDVNIDFACKQQNFDFVECLKLNPYSISRCQNSFEAVFECQSSL